MSSDPPARARERVDALDALRGLLALGVVVYHLDLWLWDRELTALGTYAVYIFFVLSGFAMTWVYRDEAPDAFPVRRFYVARLARIAPLWWAATLGTVLLALPDFVGWSPLVENLTFLSALTPTTDIPLGGWSIEIEVVFYLLLPALLVLLRRPAALAVACGAALVLRIGYVETIWPDRGSPSTVEYFQLPTFLTFFLGGMAIAHLRRGLASARGGRLALAGALLVVGTVSLNGLTQEQLLSGPLAVVLTITSIVGAGLVAWCPRPRHAALRWTCETLGAISYGVYLLHPLVFTVVNRLDLPRGVTAAAVFVVSIVAAWMSYHWFERPVARWTRRRAGQGLGAADPRSGTLAQMTRTGGSGTPSAFRWSEITPDPNAPEVIRARQAVIDAARREPVRNRVQHLRSLAQGKDVLDVGVVEHMVSNEQTDRWLHRHLVDAAKTCVGVDILADDVAVLVERGYDVRVHDLVASPLDETFDLIVAGELIEHLDQPGPFLANARRMLRPGGRLVLTTPNPYMLHRTWKHLRGEHPDSADHALLLGPGQIVELASRADLALDAWRGILLKDLAGAKNRLTSIARRTLARGPMADEIRCDSLIYELVPAGELPAP